MAFTKSTTSTALAGTLIKISSVTNSSEDNVTGAASGRVYQIRVDNSLNSGLPAYVKIKDASSATVGTDNPDFTFFVPGGSTLTYVINTGDPYAAGVCVWCTTAPETANASAPQNAVSATLLVS